MRRKTLLALASVLALGAIPVHAQRAPGAPDAAALRSSIARLQAQRAQWQSEANRKDDERRDLEQRLERVRREQQVLEQRMLAADRELRQLEQSLAQVQ
jgi:septal ring factor EnvC (AmiA/AmiB activator)